MKLCTGSMLGTALLLASRGAAQGVGGAAGEGAATTVTPVATQTPAASANGGSVVGTWSTKSNKTLTGPNFYNPVEDSFIEPDLPGISYSFTSDGHYEEAYYRAIANPADPSCPGGIMQWQHGTYTETSNGSLTLTPIAVDGRQLLSQPCNYSAGIFSRYDRKEFFRSSAVYLDPYHNIARLDMYGFDGTPLAPMYLVYSPPEMLPTTTLNPTSTTSGAAATVTSKKMKRGLETEVPVNWKVSKSGGVDLLDPDHWWWVGLTMTGVGGLLYFGPRRMGIHV